jgi:hypothetical protein
MKRLFFIGGLVGVVVPFSIAIADGQNEQPTVQIIPLKEIWANRMPDTRDIRELDPVNPLVLEIEKAIGFPPQDKAQRGFAVEGEGLEALRAAHAVFVDNDKKKARDTFPAGSEVSAVFFAHDTHPFVQLHKVERQGNRINVYYRFVFHETEETMRFIAIVPLGKLSSGKYRVDVIRSPMGAGSRLQQVTDEVARRIVCQSFSFTVTARGATNEKI